MKWPNLTGLLPDATPSTASSRPTTPSNRPRIPLFFKKLRQYGRIGLLVLVLLLVLAGGYWLFGGGPGDSSARVDGRVHALASGVEGRVAAVLVTENQLVTAGQPLVRLEDGQLGAELAEAKARLESLRLGISPDVADLRGTGQPGATAEDAIRARMQSSRSEETLARRNLEQMTTFHAQALLEVRRLDVLSGSSTPARGRIDAARKAELEARSRMEAARDTYEAVSRARAGADGELRYRTEATRSVELPSDLRARQLEMQEARVREAEQRFAAATIVAPVDGQVARIGVSPGAPVRQGQIVTAVMPIRPGDLWITAHIAEENISRVAPGMVCTVFFPAYKQFSLPGVVESVLAGTSGMVPAIDDSPESLRPRSGIAVRIGIPDYKPETMPALRVGMQASVRIEPIL
ncbi:MAG: HlyD family efflux transporter periplasmic adaptor subunit [Bilophila sp.]